eukprot:SAG11_NODE_23972_length_380_cov_0.736655_1_plen_42_part_01
MLAGGALHECGAVDATIGAAVLCATWRLCQAAMEMVLRNFQD